MLRRAVIVPDAPALVPALGGADSIALRAVREAMLRAIGDTNGRWEAIGVGDRSRRVAQNAVAQLAGYGRDGSFGLSERTILAEHNPEPALLVACWLRETANLPGMPMHLLGPDLSAQECAVLGKQRAAHADTLLVLGSGTFTWEPGDGTDQREHRVDLAVRDALAAGDAAPLAALDAAECDAVHAGGRAPWQALAGASEGAPVTAELHYSAAPFGVRYHVATWNFSR